LAAKPSDHDLAAERAGTRPAVLNFNRGEHHAAALNADRGPA
jgi:hypothetical protein